MRKAMLSKSRQLDTSYTTITGRREWSHLIRMESPRSLSWILSKGKERIRLPASPSFRRQRGIQGFGSHQETTTQVEEVYSSMIWPPRFNIQIRYSFRRAQALYSYIDLFKVLKSLITQTRLIDRQSLSFNILFSSLLLTTYLLTNLN